MRIRAQRSKEFAVTRNIDAALPNPVEAMRLPIPVAVTAWINRGIPIASHQGSRVVHPPTTEIGR